MGLVLICASCKNLCGKHREGRKAQDVTHAVHWSVWWKYSACDEKGMHKVNLPLLGKERAKVFSEVPKQKHALEKKDSLSKPFYYKWSSAAQINADCGLWLLQPSEQIHACPTWTTSCCRQHPAQVRIFGSRSAPSATSLRWGLAAPPALRGPGFGAGTGRWHQGCPCRRRRGPGSE